MVTGGVPTSGPVPAHNQVQVQAPPIIPAAYNMWSAVHDMNNSPTAGSVRSGMDPSRFGMAYDAMGVSAPQGSSAMGMYDPPSGPSSGRSAGGVAFNNGFAGQANQQFFPGNQPYTSQYVSSPTQMTHQLSPYSHMGPMPTSNNGAGANGMAPPARTNLPMKRKSMTEAHGFPPYDMQYDPPTGSSAHRLSIASSLGRDRESSLEAANALAGMGQGQPMRAASFSNTSGHGSVRAPPLELAGDTAAGTRDKIKKKKKRKDGDEDGDDSRRKTSRACDVCVSDVQVVRGVSLRLVVRPHSAPRRSDAT